MFIQRVCTQLCNLNKKKRCNSPRNNLCSSGVTVLPFCKQKGIYSIEKNNVKPPCYIGTYGKLATPPVGHVFDGSNLILANCVDIHLETISAKLFIILTTCFRREDL